jgi:hypothetical protein
VKNFFHNRRRRTVCQEKFSQNFEECRKKYLLRE